MDHSETLSPLSAGGGISRVVVLDINGVLADIKKQHTRDRSPGRPADFVVPGTGQKVYFRPGLHEFARRLSRLRSSCGVVVVSWTSRRSHNALSVEAVLRRSYGLVTDAALHGEDSRGLGLTGYRPRKSASVVRDVVGRLGHGAGRFDILFVDDSPAKILRDPESTVLPVRTYNASIDSSVRTDELSWLMSKIEQHFDHA